VKYVVRYEIEGFPGEKTSGPYETMVEAQAQAADIRSFEGVMYARVYPHEEKDHGDRERLSKL